MGYPIFKTVGTVISSTLLGLTGVAAISPGAIAQQSECLPPKPGEYLVLVINPEDEEQEAVAQLLPSGRNATICNYLGEVVTRVGGYTDSQEANALAQTIAVQTGLGAFVTRPPQGEANPVQETVPPPSAPTIEPQSGVPLVPGQTIQATPVDQPSSPPPLVLPPEITGTPETAPNPIVEPQVEAIPLEGLSVSLPDTADLANPAPVQVSPTPNPPPQISAPTSSAPPPLPEDLEAPVSPIPQVLTAPPRVSNTPVAMATATPYNPQPLNEGYAVLVDYFNQPEVAAQLQQIVGKNVGLVSYGQRPYLLVMHTQSEQSANSTLQTLSARGFLAMVADSSQVILLTPQVTLF